MVEATEYTKPGYRRAQEALINPSHPKDHMRHVMTVYLDHEPWGVAADGFMNAVILAVKGNLAGTITPPAEVGEVLAAHLSARLEEQQDLPFAWFRDFCLGDEAQQRRPNCQRCGERCPHCTGQTREGRDYRAAQFGSVVFNCNLLAMVLPYLEADTVKVGTSRLQLARPDRLHVRAPDWALVQMGMNLEKSDVKLEEYLQERAQVEEQGLRIKERPGPAALPAPLDPEALREHLQKALALADVRLKPDHQRIITEYLLERLTPGCGREAQNGRT